MKTLVIHPKDPTTEFLSVIYKGKGFKVITYRMNDHDLIRIIKRYDRIMMMGHGTPNGLIGYNWLFTQPEFISVLRTKDCVCIWCNADQYVEREGIKGFYTGMFISEVSEARIFGIDVTQEEIDYSNNLFVAKMKNIINFPNFLNEIKSSYVGDCPVIKFNNDRLYYKNDNSIVKSELLIN